jgi:hypothetical protein
MKRFLLLSILCVTFASTAHAQDEGEGLFQQWKENRRALVRSVVDRKVGTTTGEDADNQITTAKNQLSQTLSQGVVSASFNRLTLAYLLGDFSILEAQGNVTAAATKTSADAQLLIAAQNATIIEQNKQMIALLQKIADKK